MELHLSVESNRKWCRKIKRNSIKRFVQKEITFCTMERAWMLLQLPWLKLPQLPLGVPKLANSIEEMTWLVKGHSSDSTGPGLLPLFRLDLHISTCWGWDSEMWEHKLPVSLVAKDSCVGSPPVSSNNTRVFPLGCSHDRGTWYLPRDQKQDLRPNPITWFLFLQVFSWNTEFLILQIRILSWPALLCSLFSLKYIKSTNWKNVQDSCLGVRSCSLSLESNYTTLKIDDV